MSLLGYHRNGMDMSLLTTVLSTHTAVYYTFKRGGVSIALAQYYLAVSLEIPRHVSPSPRLHVVWLRSETHYRSPAFGHPTLIM